MAFELKQDTLDFFVEEIVTRYSDRPALGLYGHEAVTFKEMGIRIREYQEMLLAHGIGPGDKVVLLSPSNPEIAMAHLAVMSMGAVAAPIMEEFPPQDIASLINWIEAPAIFTTARLYESIKEGISHPFKVVWDVDNGKVIAKALSAPAQRRPLKEDDLAEILFTSGTTGHSKGVMLTQKNLVSNLWEGPDMVKCIHDHSLTLSLLPLAHAYGSTSGFLAIIYCGSAVYFLGRKPTPKFLMKALSDLRPTILGGVPLIFEKIYARKIAPLLAKNPVMRILAKWKPTKHLLYRIMGRAVRQAFGGNLDCAIIGGAPLAKEVELFLRLAKIPTVLGYGMTETSPLITFASREEAAAKPGSVGRAIRFTEINIANPDPETGVGEVWVKGPGVMKGYYENPEETALILKNGWLNTGDLGYLDEEGFLFLKGRSKNVILGPSGENIYPEVIEAVLAQYVEVDEVLVLMEDNQLTARIFPSPDILETLPAEKEKWQQRLELIRTEVNEKIPAHSRLTRITLQEEPFIMTVTNKIKRAAYYNR